MIQYLERSEIHDKKWNGCVHFGFNGLPYGYTWYLDQVAEHWTGIVMNDYEAVLPVVSNRKFGISYMYQPLFTQQLGIFSLSPLSKREIDEIWQEVPREIQFIEIQVSKENKVEQEDLEWTPKRNMILDLNRSYETIEAGYSGNIKRHLKKADKHQLKIRNTLKPEEFIAFFEKHTVPKIAEYKKKHHHMLHRLIYHAIHYHVGSLVAIRNERKEIVAGGFFLFNSSRVINLLPTVNEEGRASGATALMYDYMIRLNSNQNKVFDFEGSMIPSIAKFYKGFGAIDDVYWQIKRNTLPWYLRLIKK